MLTTLAIAYFTATTPPMGWYTVPTDAELRPYAGFDVHCAFAKEEGGKYHLEYDLPLELTDRDSRHVVLDEESRDGHFVKLIGSEGHAVCLNLTDRFSCMISYSTMEIDEDEVQAYVAAKYPEPAERAARAKLARAFGGDPAGILELKQTP